jgi:alcohol dehydrogenase class IV
MPAEQLDQFAIRFSADCRRYVPAISNPPIRQVNDAFSARDIGAQRVILDSAIDHAAETICSRNPQPFAYATCLHRLSLLADSLRQSKSDPCQLEVLLKGQLVVWLGYTGLNRIEWGASHGIGHQLGAVADFQHGHKSYVMGHNGLRYNREANEERQTLICKALRRPDTSVTAQSKNWLQKWRCRPGYAILG